MNANRKKALESVVLVGAPQCVVALNMSLELLGPKALNSVERDYFARVVITGKSPC